METTRGNQCSIVGIAIRLRAWRSGVQIRAGSRNFSLQNVQTDSGPPSLLIQWVRGFCPGVKRSGREVNHSLPSGAEVKNEWGCTSSSPVCLRDVDRESLTNRYPLPQLTTIHKGADQSKRTVTENWSHWIRDSDPCGGRGSDIEIFTVIQRDLFTSRYSKTAHWRYFIYSQCSCNAGVTFPKWAA
jgi:hypothetical protein